LEIENFQFAIATEAGALQAQSGMSQEQTEQTGKEKFCRRRTILVDCTTAMQRGNRNQRNGTTDFGWHG